MKMRMSLEYHDGKTEEVLVSPLAIIGWEKYSGKKMTDLGSGGGVSMGDMGFMAYEQHRLMNGTDDIPEYEEWIAFLADLSMVDTTDPPSGDEAP
jgi:hypothetical protein